MEYDPLPSSKPSREDSDTPSEARPADGAQGEAASSQAAPPHIDPLSSGAVAPAAPQLSARQSDEDPPDPGRRWRRLRAWVIYPAVTAMLAAAAGIGVAASIRRPEVAELGSYVPLLVTQVKDRYGEVVRTYSRENRIMLREGEVPPMLQNAIVATEDANFFNHGGVDLKGVARAAVTNLRAGRIREGASTITMQLSRGLFSLTREQKWWRKVEEAFLSVELEKNYSKQQILTMYANLVNLGHGNYGMEAAARAYFNKSVAELTLAETATLAGIPQRPNYFSVRRRPEAVLERRNWVLSRMLDEQMVSREAYEEAKAQPLLVKERRKEKELGPYFTEEVRRHLIETYGATDLYDRGMRIETTLDPEIQSAAEDALHKKLLALDHGKGWRGIEKHFKPEEDLEAVALPSWGDGLPRVGEWFEGIVLESGARSATVRYRSKTYELGAEGIAWTRAQRPDKLLKVGNVAWFRLEAPLDDEGEETGEPPILRLEQEPELEGAVVVLESATGAIRAMVGGWSYERNEFNRVTQAKRQVGSAFKPFVFGAALESGYTASDTLFDGPAIFRGASADDVYSPRNYKRQYYGIITLRTALEDSINVFAVKLMDLVGVDRAIDFARRAGVRSELPPYPSLALGSADLTPLELASAYAAIVNHGIQVEPYTIERITARDGRAIWEHQTRAHKAMEPGVAYVLTEMMHGVSQRGTAAKLGRLPIETGGKTGTTNAFTDAWFAGFTPRYTIVSWVGYDKQRSIGRGMTGAQAALPIWTDLVERGLEAGWLEEGETFEPPAGVVAVTVDAGSGLRWSSLSSKPIEEFFLEGTEPERTLDQDTARVLAMPWYLQEPFYLPKEGERMPADIEDWQAVRDVWKGKNKREALLEKQSG